MVSAFSMAFSIVVSAYGIANLYYRLPIWEMLSWLHHYFRQPVMRFLVMPDNGHMVVVPKVLYVLDYELFSARGGFLIVSSVVLILASAVVFSAGAKLGDGWRGAARWGSIVIVAGALLWLAAWESLLSPMQVLVFVCFFFALSSFACIAGRGTIGADGVERMTWARVAGSLGLMILALFSFGYGLVAAVCFCGLAVVRRLPGRQRAAILGVSLLGILAFCYGIGFHLPEYNTDPTKAIFRPFQAGAYLVRLLGAAPRALVQGLLPDGVAGVMGDLLAVGGLLYAAWEIIAAARRGDAAREGTRFLIATALLAVGAAMLTALGRMDFGLGHARSSRYMTNAVIFWMALGGLAWRRSRGGTYPARVVLSVALASVSVLVAVSNVWQLAEVTAYRGSLREFRWMLVNRVYPSAMFPTVHPQSDWARRIFRELDQRAWSVFGEREATWIWRPLPAVAIGHSTECIGSFDIKRPLEEGSPYTYAGGWAYDTGRHRAVEYVVVTDSRDIVRAVGRSTTDRPDVMKARPEVRLLRTGWVAYVADPVPLDGYRAYAFLERDGNYASCRLQ